MANNYVYVFLDKPIVHHLIEQSDYGLGGYLIKKDIISVEIEQQDGTVYEIPTGNVVAIEKHSDKDEFGRGPMTRFLENVADKVKGLFNIGE